MTAPRSRTSYDIQIMRGGRWATETRLTDEDVAKTTAQSRVADPKCEGVRVLRCWLRADGTEMENEIFCKTQTVREDSVDHIDHVDLVPEPCKKLEDYFGLASRLVMGRIFHSYLDKVTLTPTEVLHSSRDLKRLRDKGTMVPSAVDRVASLQARASGGDAKARREEIFKAIEDILAKARNLESIGLPSQKNSLTDIVNGLPPTTDQWERDYLVRTALTRDLKDIRSFSGKLERLCKLAQGVEVPALAALMDGFIAELLETSAVQEILGWQAGLGAAICSMIDLADGTFSNRKSDAPEAAALLNRLFAERRLPESRAGMIDRAHRQVSAASPLYRSDDQQEYDAFKKVLLKLLTLRGLLDGPKTALALTHRYLHLTKGGARFDAVSGVFRAMPDRAYGIIYLCELAHGEFAAEAAMKLAETYPAGIEGQHITNLVQSRLSPKDRMLRAACAFNAVMAAPYAQDIKQPVLSHIDRLLDEYLVEEKIIERLDHPGSALRDRALRLVQFCSSGVLPEGRALTRARQRTIELLRQPNFDEHFVEGIADPVKARDALRDFHRLLVGKAGFAL